MEFLTDDRLIEAYSLAIEHNLDYDFIKLLKEEIDRRHIAIEPSQK
ncbi:sporulation histidine kinase inhibitor Sda [Pullulanibacillus sp. KACC 23026]|nr:sporulation histidine kinase inhibitor Sda [Pullulanibacillus sp. KACC 23026]WEG12924.1 sporulation histidine kinase inhibitor Sda [Pullulanibacillus sp. KACC 23026]